MRRDPSDGAVLMKEIAMRYVALLSLMVSLAACATTTNWAPGPGQTLADFEPAEGRCSIMARHGGGGFAAYGSPSYVAGASLGYAAGEAGRAQADFSDCMKASGWRSLTPEAAAARNTRAAGIQGIMKQRADCITQVRSNSAYAHLQSHWSDALTSGFTMAQITNDQTPTAREAAEISAYWDEAKPCATSAMTALSQLEPRFAPIMAQSLADNESAWFSLIKRKITWGEWSQRLKASTDTAKARAASI
jgi:hypothetical protein